MRTGTIKFLKKVKKAFTETLYNDGDQFKVNIHYIGVRGGFERHADETMEGCIDPIVIVEIIETGVLLSLELHYEVSIVLDTVITL